MEIVKAWDESEHPRAEDGKFGGGGKGIKPAQGAEAPEGHSRCKRCKLDIPFEQGDDLEDHGLLAGQKGHRRGQAGLKGSSGQYAPWNATHTSGVKKEFDESEHPRAEDGKFSNGGGGGIIGGPKGIGESLAAAERADREDKAKVGAALDKLADGHTIKDRKKTWTKFDAGGDKFWTDGKKNLTSAQLYTELGARRTAEHVPDALPDWVDPTGSARWTRPDNPPEFHEMSRHHEAENKGWEATGDVTETGNVIYNHPKRAGERLFVGPKMWRHYKEGTVLGGGKIDDDSMRTHLGDLKRGKMPELQDAMKDPKSEPRQWTTESATNWGRSEAKQAMGLSDDEASFISLRQGTGEQFKVGDQAMEMGGYYDPRNGAMVVYLDSHKDRAIVGGMLAHEVQHSKFRPVIQEFNGEYGKITEIHNQMVTDLGSVAAADKEMYVHPVTSDQLTPKYAKMFPVWTTFKSSPILSSNNKFSGQGDGPDAWRNALADSGSRVSPYAASYWKEWKAGKIQTDQAVNETLAEVARIKYDLGDDMVPKEWADLHLAFVDHYHRISTMGARF